jgi:hypothetical protein
MLYSISKSQIKDLSINTLKENKASLFFLLLFSTLINLFPSSFAFCQSQTTTEVDSVALISSNSLDSSLLAKKIKTNFSIGIRSGVTYRQFEIANSERNDKNAGGIGSVFTLFANYAINSKFSIQPEVALGRYRSDNTLYKIALVEGTVDYTISTFDLNLLGIYSYPITDWLSLSAEIGGSVNYQYNSFGKVVTPTILTSVSYDVDSNNQFEKFNSGLLVGITPSITLKRITFQASARYRYGLNNINAFDYRLNRYLADSKRTIQTRDILIQIGILVPIYRNAKLRE